MIFTNFWDYILNIRFLITVGLLLVPFLALGWSVWRTWEDNARPRR